MIKIDNIVSIFLKNSEKIVRKNKFLVLFLPFIV